MSSKVAHLLSAQSSSYSADISPTSYTCLNKTWASIHNLVYPTNSLSHILITSHKHQNKKTPPIYCALKAARDLETLIPHFLLLYSSCKKKSQKPPENKLSKREITYKVYSGVQNYFRELLFIPIKCICISFKSICFASTVKLESCLLSLVAKCQVNKQPTGLSK